jgi:hypothetical protein
MDRRTWIQLIAILAAAREAQAQQRGGAAPPPTTPPATPPGEGAGRGGRAYEQATEWHKKNPTLEA